jgi:hypothetical protein
MVRALALYGANCDAQEYLLWQIKIATAFCGRKRRNKK